MRILVEYLMIPGKYSGQAKGKNLQSAHAQSPDLKLILARNLRVSRLNFGAY